MSTIDRRHAGGQELAFEIESHTDTVPHLWLLGVRVHNITSQEMLSLAGQWLATDTGRLYHIVTVNPEFIMLARRDNAFGAVLEFADIATVDGIGIVLGARLLGQRVRERVTGVDLTESIASIERPQPRIFFLGAAQGVAEEAAAKLKAAHPNLLIAGTYSGSPAPEDAADILFRIEGSGANILLVAFGAPAQDRWIADHRRELAACGIVLAIGVGGTFDYLAGRVPRPPQIVRRAGLEWLYRLIRQPWRWRRQLVLPLFAALVLRERLRGKGNRPVSNDGNSED